MYARVRKLGKPTIITTAKGFILVWGDHQRNFTFDDHWSDEETAKLIARLRRW
jgi:hypothetical protein